MDGNNEVKSSFLSMSTNNEIDPTEFDLTMHEFLLNLGADKYINIFRRKNIGMSTLTVLTDEDLIKLGVEDPTLRKRLVNEVKFMPIYEETSAELSKTPLNLGLMEIVDLLEETSQQLYRIHLSMLANTLAIKKTKNLTDCLIYEDKYASDVALSTLSEITNIINSMDIMLCTHPKMRIKETNKKIHKKIFVGTVGGVVITMLAVLFVRSMKQLK